MNASTLVCQPQECENEYSSLPILIECFIYEP